MIARAVARVLTAPLVAGDRGGGPGPWPRRDAIVVLGAPLAPDGGLSAVSRERNTIAAALWRAGAAPRVIVTGGVTRGAARAEAVVMAEDLVADGVPRSAIVIEDRAVTTVDNAARVRALCPDVRTIWLATQRFHTRRAARIFRAAGFEARAVWSDDLERAAPVAATRWALREYAAWARWLTRRTPPIRDPAGPSAG